MTQDLPPVAPETPQADPQTPVPGALDTLQQAMRRARHDNAERSGVLADLRATRLARLELLQEALNPLTAQIPADVDIFDIGLMPGANPRLFIDMLAFVEMGRDGRLYRLFQDTRYGRTKIADSEDIETLVEAVTEYVARRLIEREKALAADMMRPKASRGSEPTGTAPSTEPSPAPTARHDTGSRGARWFTTAFAFLIDLLGSVAFFMILAWIVWYLWTRMHMPVP